MQLLSNLLSNHCNSNRLDNLSIGTPMKMQKRKIKSWRRLMEEETETVASNTEMTKES
jgi:hypothetical protein